MIRLPIQKCIIIINDFHILMYTGLIDTVDYILFVSVTWNTVKRL